MILHLYTYMYIAFLAVHTNQKRFQSERPREKIISSHIKNTAWVVLA